MRSLSINTTESRFGVFVWIACASWAFLLLPRIDMLVAGYAMWEDWGTHPVAHLESYRPVAALELALMQAVFGDQYLQSVTARLIGAGYLAIGFTIILAIQRRLGLNLLGACLLAAVISLHPMFNEFLLWGVLSSFWLAFGLVAIGAWLVLFADQPLRRASGLILVALAGGSYQLCVMLPACIVLLEITAKGVRGYAAQPVSEHMWRLGMVMVAPLTGVVSLFVLRHGLGFVDFDGRGASLANAGSSEWVAEKFYVVSNAFANTYQAPLGQAFGRDLAISSFWLIVVSSFVTCLVIAVTSQGNALDRFLRGFAIPLSFLLALIPLALASAAPTGFRVIAFATFSAWMVAGPVLKNIEMAPITRWLGLLAFGIIASSCVYSTRVDAAVRLESFKRDIAYRDRVVGLLRRGEASHLTVCGIDYAPGPIDNDDRGIVVSYNRATAASYSNINRFPTLFLSASNLGVARVDHVPYSSKECAGISSGSSHVEEVEGAGSLFYRQDGDHLVVAMGDMSAIMKSRQSEAAG